MKSVALLLACLAGSTAGLWCAASGNLPPAVFRVDVNMVVLTFTVTDSHGRYVDGLQARDLRVHEDGIEQRIAGFTAGTGTHQENPLAPALEVDGDADRGPAPLASSIFVLMDTSNAMYETFTRAEDAVERFLRGLPASQAVAVYSFSRNLYRAAPLTHEHFQAIRALRGLAAGDNTALYNAILLTLRDAARVPGRKIVVVFSNGPDDSSIVSPHDVGRVAQDEGIPVYIISTRAREPADQAAFRMVTEPTGGKSYVARDWHQQETAFRQVEDEMAHSYTVAYYPHPNTNHGFRKILVEVAGRQYRVRVRPGYRPRARYP